MLKESRLYLIIVILVLSACGSQLRREVEAGAASTVSTQPPATAQVTVTEAAHPTPTVTSSPATLEAQATPLNPTETPIPSPTPTDMPFVCPYLRGRIENGSLQSSAMGEQVRFLVHLPPCYDQFPTKAFPVLYLFHGWPLNEWHWINLGVTEWSDDWVSRGLVGPFILVFPGVDRDGRYVYSSGGSASFEGFIVDELVPHIDQTFRTLREPEGRAVGGISRGGVWALEIAMRHQDLFASAGGHSPALALNNPLPQYDPFLLAREDMSGLRLYLDAGDGDWARASTIRLRDLLIELGVDVTYELHSGGHVDGLWTDGIPDYLTFYTAPWPASYEELPAWSEPEPSATP